MSKPMTNCAAFFEAPISSEEHATLRDSAWMGGALVEARYLLGRIASRNFFLVSDDEFKSSLEQYFATYVCRQAAKVLAVSSMDLGVRFLRHQCRGIDDIAFVGSPREAQAVFLLAKQPSLTDEDLAAAIGTTVKQIQRISSLKHFRRLWNNQLLT
jgi:hypothetical protein